jgi:hypothetical protein
MDLKTPRVKTRTKCLESPSGGKSKKALLLLLCFLCQCLRQCLYVIHPYRCSIWPTHSSLGAVYATFYNSTSCPPTTFCRGAYVILYLSVPETCSKTIFLRCTAVLRSSPASPFVVLIEEALALLLRSMVFRVGNYGS